METKTKEIGKRKIIKERRGNTKESATGVENLKLNQARNSCSKLLQVIKLKIQLSKTSRTLDAHFRFFEANICSTLTRHYHLGTIPL